MGQKRVGKLEDAKRAATEATKRRAGWLEVEPDELPEPEVPLSRESKRALKAGLESARTGKTVSLGSFTKYAREGTPAQRLEVRLRAGERAKLVLAADRAGLALSVWAREILLKAAVDE